MAGSTQAPKYAIRLLRKGCTNRPFYHVVVAHAKELGTQPGLEQLGTYDPLPNENDEKLLALNVDRLNYWLAQGATVRRQAGILLGLAGVLPFHPHCLTTAWRNRQKMLAESKTSKDDTEGTQKTN